MKNETFHVALAIIWGLGALAWIGVFVKQGGRDPFQIVACVCSAIYFALNLRSYFQVRKQKE